MTESSDGSALEAIVESERFDQISITLHWLTALLIIVMFATAWSREAVHHDTRLASALMTAHRSTGVVTWIVGWVRLVWRYNFAYLPPFPESMPKLQQWIAKANEYGLYALLLAQPISGLGNVLFRGHPFTLFIWEMPVLFEANPAIRSVFVGGSRARRQGAPHPTRRRRALPPPNFARRCTATDVTVDLSKRTSTQK